MKTHGKFYGFCCVIAVLAIVAGCDIYRPQKSFLFAIPKNDFLYNTMFAHMKSVLEQQGYEVSVTYTDRNIEANRMVAKNEADLAFVNNVSSHVTDELGTEIGGLRTVLPLTKRALLGFARQPQTGKSAREIFENKTAGIELLNGEGHQNVIDLFSRAHLRVTRFVQSDESDFDIRLIWGSPYGKRAQIMLDSGWHAISFDQEWIEFQTLSDPALEAITLPALPGDPQSATIHTFATDAVLVASRDMGENAVYRLTETILQSKLALVRDDPMYRSVTESINSETLLYPLHEGTSSYLRRDRPAFLERYSDALALVLSVSVFFYGIAQAIKSRIKQIKKDRIDEYFLEFLDIRSQEDLSNADQVRKLNGLFQRALLQMTHEKMDKGDFHIFSRLIQQELTNLRLNA